MNVHVIAMKRRLLSPDLPAYSAEPSESGSAGVETEGAECEDLCCPTLQASADGGWKLHIPLASIITTLGGLSLIVTHFGNLCCSSACAKQILTK